MGWASSDLLLLPVHKPWAEAATALWSLNYANYANPAALSRQFLVRASAGMRFDNISTVDAGNGRKNLVAGSFGALQFGVPLLSNKLGIGFTFEPFSRVNYKVTTSGTLDLDPTQNPVPYTVITQGSGGLQVLRLGAGVRPVRWVSVGVTMDYMFGIIEDTRRTQFVSPQLLTTNIAETTRMRGFTATGGAILSIPVGENRELSVAAATTFPATLSAKRVRTVGESLDQDTLGTTIGGDLTLPASTRLGMAFTANSRWAVTADMRLEPWTEFESSMALSSFRSGGMQDRSRISAGVEFLPAGGNVTLPYVRRIAYRLGFYVDGAYVTPATGQSITAQAITAGVSLPTMFGGTRVDLNLQVGRRGSASGVLVQDRFVTFSATVNVGERWFLKRRLG